VTTHRAAKMGDLVREILARLLREEIRDPRIGFVTLTDVRMGQDLKHAHVFFSVLGGSAPRAAAGKALAHAAPFLRRALAREAGLRYTPELHFEEDASVDTGFRVDELLREISAEQEPHDSGGVDEGDGEDDER
jgi:ribosome-binding factor A